MFKPFALNSDLQKTRFTGLGASSFAILLLVWCLLSYGGMVKPMFLPNPGEVLRHAYLMLEDGSLLGHALISTWRVTAGFLLAAALGVPLGILMGTMKPVQAFFEPMIGFIRYMPASAFIPLFILWIGLGEAEKIAVIFFGTFFQMVLMVMDVTKNIPRELVEVSYTLGAGRLTVFTKVVLPAALPGIVDTLRITFGWAWTYLVVAEIVGASSGLGFMIMQSSRFLQSADIFVGILVIGLLGMITDLLFKLLYRLLFPWLAKEGS